MQMATEPVKQVCYADDLTVWATGVKIRDMEDSLNRYLEKITAYLDNYLLISAPKLSVTLFTQDKHQAKTHPKLLIEDSQLTLVQCPKINKHNSHVSERVSSRTNVLKALAGTSWGQQKETFIMTYKVVGRSIINYAAETYVIPTSEISNERKMRLWRFPPDVTRWPVSITCTRKQMC